MATAKTLPSAQPPRPGVTLDRRVFLTGAGALAAAAFGKLASADGIKLPPLDAPSEKAKPLPRLAEPPEQRLGIAVVGLGHLTLDQIVPAFAASRSTRLVALVSGDRKKAETLAAHTGVEPKRIFDDAGFDRIKDDPAIDAVYIVLPNSMHAEYTVRAAAAGKHVLCEKPMAPTAADCEKMIDACKRADRRLMIAYRIQYEPHNRFVMKAVRDKRFGKIRVIEGFNGQNIGDPGQWRLKRALAGGGALPDIGLYCLDTCRFLLGEEPAWVSGTTFSTPGDARFKEVEETCMFQLGFPSGAVGNFTTSYGTHLSRRYRALGDAGGWIGCDPAFDYSGLAVEQSEVRGGEQLRTKPEIPEKQQFALELDHFAAAVRGKYQPYTPGEEGLQDVRIMEAIYQSARDGRRVELPRVSKLDAFRGRAPDPD